VENARSLIAGIKSAMMTIPCSRKHALKEPQRNALAAGRTPQYSSYCALCMSSFLLPSGHQNCPVSQASVEHLDSASREASAYARAMAQAL
jgi:PAB1-binding protein PBP1